MFFLLAFFLVACSSEKDEYHQDDKELAPVDWSKWNRPELHYYVREGEIEEIKKAIKTNPSVVSEKSANGSGSALFEAVRHGKYEIVSLLAESGADVNESLQFIDYNSPNVPKLDMRGYTPLHLAVENADGRMVKLLLSLGASTDATYHGKTVLEFAREQKNSSLIEILSNETESD
ncbi:ankyrin repeat domain-containing protein [Coraliomargarita sinensis]|uniref:ankyrin repeat domain-containing protein n=1 Tax=Coraliomargarita sinensis TaxID=2174842 RepID=UPI0013047F24|nr:ankyrin repeat domain-containing protein [Coraliomargarita sinensis]